MLLETRRRMNKRSMEVAELARQYQQKRGMLDSGFYKELEAFSEANPLFEDLRVSETPQHDISNLKQKYGLE